CTPSSSMSFTRATGSYAATCAFSISHSNNPSNERPLWPSTSTTPPAPARPRIAPSTHQHAIPSRRATWGTRSFNDAGARLLQRSCASVMCVSASTTFTWSSGSVVIAVPFVLRVLGEAEVQSAVARVEPAAGHDFGAREELHALGAVRVEIAEQRLLP